jgi:very-short-patch-repair endonuclease
MKRLETTRARTLRRDATDAEKLLWWRLRNRQIAGAKFRRQFPVGRYIADFACIDAMLIVEADGGQHTPEADAVRTAALEAAGYKVTRFWNTDILSNIDGVLESIRQELISRTPHPPTG